MANETESKIVELLEDIDNNVSSIRTRTGDLSEIQGDVSEIKVLLQEIVKLLKKDT